MDTAGVLIILATGIAVIAVSLALDRLWAVVIPSRALYLAIRAPGVALHECAHMIGCLLTGARIGRVVLFSAEGGSVTYSRPAVPIIGDVVIGTAPLFLLSLFLSLVTEIFSAGFSCALPAFPPTIGSTGDLLVLLFAIAGTFSGNLLVRFNAWFLLYLGITISIVLSIAPSMQDMKNAALGSALLIIAGILVYWSGIPPAISLADWILRMAGYGFTLGIVYGLIALAASLPLLAWHLISSRP